MNYQKPSQVNDKLTQASPTLDGELEYKKPSNTSNPPSPPQEYGKESHTVDERRNAENIYISLIKKERLKDESNIVENQNKSADLQLYVNDNREKEEEEYPDIYKNLNTVIPSVQWGMDTTRTVRKRRASYKRTAIKNRIREFLNELDGFALLHDWSKTRGVTPKPIHKKLMEYYIQKFDLAQDRLAVKQYLKRLILYGYFRVKNGCYIFVSKNPRQVTFNDILEAKDRMAEIRALTHELKDRKSY